jgi:hypothetical protein
MRKAIVSLVAALAVTALAAPAAGAAGRSGVSISEARTVTKGVARITAASLPGREKVRVGRCRRGRKGSVTCPFTLKTRGRTPMACTAQVTVARRRSGRLRITTTTPLCGSLTLAPPPQDGPGGVPPDQLVMPTLPEGDTGLLAPPTPDQQSPPGGPHDPVGTGPQS